MVTTSEGQTREVEFVITDDCGNTSTLQFQIEGKPDAECFKGEIPQGTHVVHYDQDFVGGVDDAVNVVIRKGSLYESIAMKMERSDVVIKADTSVKVLSPAYAIHDENTPLQTAIGLVFKAEVEKDLQPYATLASVRSDGRLSYVGGRYRIGNISVRTSSLGTYCVVADKTAPTIRPQFESGQDCRSRNAISFRLADNFSGVSSYAATIDGKWVAIDYAHSRATINLKEEGIGGGVEHTIELTVKDSCGNTASWQGTIVR